MFVFRSACSLLFETHCIHCEAELFEHCRLLCTNCFETLILLDPKTRCQSCFQPSEDAICQSCLLEAPCIVKLASCFDYDKVAKSLLIAFKYHDRPYLARSLASFMMIQYAQLGWDFPDLLTYVPQSFLRKLSRGYNQSKLLAETLGQMMQRPVEPLLCRTHFMLSQTRLVKKERKLAPNSFAFNSGQLQGKVILLIDDVFTTGATLHNASKTLMDASAKAIYALTFCLTES